MRKEFLNGDYAEKEVKLTIRVPRDFDREDERMLDDAIADLLYKQGWELVDSKEYRNVTPSQTPEPEFSVDPLLEFIDREVPFRMKEIHGLDVPPDVMESLIEDLKDNNDVMFDYDRFDEWLLEHHATLMSERDASALQPDGKPSLSSQIHSAASRAASAPTYSLEELDLPGMLQTLENNAWGGRTPTTIRLSAGAHTVTLRGYIYEPSYENFSTSSSVSLDGEVLYGLDSRNVAAYRNEEYQAGCCESLREAISMLKEATAGHRFTIEQNSKTKGPSFER